MELTGLVLMSVGAVMYGILPLFADLNKTHVTNPQWPPHARFHVVNQVLTGFLIAVISLYLIWLPVGEARTSVALALVLGLSVIGGFFASMVFRNFYGGALGDKRGGIAKYRNLDLNAVSFGLSGLLLLSGWGLTL